MVQQVSSGVPNVVATLNPVNQGAQAKAAAKPVATITKKAVPALSELNARAFLQRQQIGAALYDRSFTLGEGARTLDRQEAIKTYAEQIQLKAGGPTDADLQKLERKLNRADAQIQRLSNNNRGANLASIEGIDGRDMDIVQENLAARIQHGLKDGSLTEEEGKTLLARQQELADVEEKLRASDGKLTAGEQKQILDQLKKTADEINQARNNGNGVNLGTYDYADSVNQRQAALQKQLEDGLKMGSLTAEEAEIVRAEFKKVDELEVTSLASGKIDWREATQLSTAMNNAEIKLYDLQRNTAGKQLADSYVDVKYVDMRQAQQLESIVRGIDNGRLTNEEAEGLLRAQQGIEKIENRLKDGGLNRGEYLRLQNEMNDFSLELSDLYNNAERYTGIIPTPPGGTTGGGSGGGTTGGGSAGGATGGGSAGGTTGGGSAGGTTGGGSAGGTTGGGSAGGTTNPSPAPANPPAPEVATPATPAAPAAEVAKPDAPKPADEAENFGKVKLAFDEVKDRFGEMMTGMMRERTDWLKSTGEKLAEKARELREEFSERDAARRENVQRANSKVDTIAIPGLGGGNAERDSKVKAYAQVSASIAPRAEAILAKKVA